MAEILTQKEIDALLKGKGESTARSPVVYSPEDIGATLEQYRKRISALQDKDKGIQEIVDSSAEYIGLIMEELSQGAETLRIQYEPYITSLEARLKQSQEILQVTNKNYDALSARQNKILEETNTAKAELKKYEELGEDYSQLLKNKDRLSAILDNANEELGEFDSDINMAPHDLAKARSSARNRLYAAIFAGVLGITGTIGGHQLGYRSSPGTQEVDQIINRFEEVSAERDKAYFESNNIRAERDKLEVDIKTRQKELDLKNQVIKGYEDAVMPYLEKLPQ